MNDFETTNLLLAALLTAGGGQLQDVIVGPRFSRVQVDLSSLDKEALAARFERLAVGIRQDDPDWTLLFDRSVLGDIEDKYLRLKRMISRSRK